MKPSHILSIGVVIIAGGILYFIFSNNFSAERQDLLALKMQEDQPISPTINGEQNRTMEQTNITIEDIQVGQGTEAKIGNTVSVQYKGTLLNGIQFDSSYDRGEPFSFTIGQGQVIQGWEQGIPGMKVGGKRKLVIPSAFAYGDRGIGSIPPNSTLVFEVELLGVSN